MSAGHRAAWHGIRVVGRVSPRSPSPDDQEARTQRAMQAIEAYVRGHPQAADSEAGIAQWWLGEMGVEASPAATREALERLVRREVLQRQVLADGSVIFRRGGRAPGAAGLH